MNEKQTELILAISESSCDETSVAVVKDGQNLIEYRLPLKSTAINALAGSLPEVASRHHRANYFMSRRSVGGRGVTLTGSYRFLCGTPGLVGHYSSVFQQQGFCLGQIICRDPQ